MSDNLKTTRFRNGESIPLIGSDSNGDTEWSDAIGPAYTIFRGNTETINTFGLLYNFYVVDDERGICPDGWRVPNEQDWKALELEAGMPSNQLDRDGWAGAEQNVAGKLKSLSSEAWDSPNEGATNETGFGWVGGSVRYSYGAFENAVSLRVFGSLWSSNEADTENAFRRLARSNKTDLRRSPTGKRSGLNIRCVTDKTVNNEEEANLPKQFKLEQNYPNPFNPSTQISFEIPSAGIVKLLTYDMLGRQQVILLNEVFPAGSHAITFDASGLASGIYLYRLESEFGVLTKKMTLLK